MFRFVLALAASAFAYTDLFAPLTIEHIGSSAYLDTIRVTTTLVNKGTTTAYSPLYPTPYTVVVVGVDSFNIESHQIPSIQAGYYWEFVDTMVVIMGAHSIQTWCDPLGAWGESGGEKVNNVRSQAFNFRPTIQIVRDTVVIYDTLEVHDTLKVVQKDTVTITERDTIKVVNFDTVKVTLHDTTRITILDTIIKNDTIRIVSRDTVIKHDTVKYCPPTQAMAKTASAPPRPEVHAAVYNAVGQLVWEGPLRQGGYPPIRLKQGLHILVQNGQVHRFRVAYK
jgi:hypothetical protein